MDLFLDKYLRVPDCSTFAAKNFCVQQELLGLLDASFDFDSFYDFFDIEKFSGNFITELNFNLSSPKKVAAIRDGVCAIVYFPWALYVDVVRADSKLSRLKNFLENLLGCISIKVGIRTRYIRAYRVSFQLHTVCQHIYWRELVPVWQKLGVTNVWLSHCPTELEGKTEGGITYHAWRLFAINVETPERRVGLEIGKPMSERTVLASFTGAHMPHYLSDIRLRLLQLKNVPGFEISVNDEWHYEKEVYGRLKGEHALPAELPLPPSVELYNQQLSNSVFALCPAGAGPNTIRLWEALAVGTIPVLMGHLPALPTNHEITKDTWSNAVITFQDPDLQKLPKLLNSISLEERERRQALCMKIFASLQNQTCF